MDAAQFDMLARSAGRHGRRRFALLLGGVAAAPFLSDDDAGGKKKARKKPLCLNGETVKASGKKRKKLMKQGATSGACCVPACSDDACGGDDGCGGTCGCSTGSVCNEGTCARCTVTCTGTPLACSTNLTLALQEGGTIVVCPGRYTGSFEVRKNTTLIGAGPGADPARNTIIDGQGTNVPTLFVFPNPMPVTFKMTGVRVTGANVSSLAGGGMYCEHDTDVRLTNCAITGNKTKSAGGGIVSFGSLRLTNSSVSGNKSSGDAGGVFLFNGALSHIEDSLIENNTAALYGGGLFVMDSPATVTGTQFRGNRAQRGGGIALDGGEVSVDSATTITNNTATQLGGGVARFDGTFSQNGASISGNRRSNGTTDNCAGVTCT